MQSIGKLTLQHPEVTAQPKTFSDSRPQAKYTLVPQTSSRVQVKPKMREIPNYPDPICSPLLNQWKNHYKICKEK